MSRKLHVDSTPCVLRMSISGQFEAILHPVKKKSLILLTKQFPYLHREQYVAHELKYLAEEFDKVYIYPHDHFRAGDESSFDLPKNAVIWNLNERIPAVSKWKIIASFTRTFFFELFRVHDKLWFLKNGYRFFSIYATQYALGNALEQRLMQDKIGKDEVVFYSYWFSASALCLAIMKSRGAILGFVSRAHALDLYHEDWGLLNDRVKVLPFRNFKQKYVDVLYTISSHGKNYLNRKYPTIKKTEVAYLGVDDYGLNPEPESPDGLFHIVTCSGIDENKRLHLLGEALSALHNLQFKWTHFGSGPLEDQLRKSVKGSNVQLDLRGQTPNHEFRNYLSSIHADLFINISRVEGLPVTLMEAASHGIPLLATAANGSVEVAVDGQNARVIPVEVTAQQLSMAIESLLSSGKLKEMRAISRRIYLQKFQASLNYKDFTQRIIH